MESWIGDGAQQVRDCLYQNFESARGAWEGELPSLEDVQIDELVEPLLQYTSNANILFFSSKMCLLMM